MNHLRALFSVQSLSQLISDLDEIVLGTLFEAIRRRMCLKNEDACERNQVSQRHRSYDFSTLNGAPPIVEGERPWGRMRIQFQDSLPQLQILPREGPTLLLTKNSPGRCYVGY